MEAVSSLLSTRASRALSHHLSTMHGTTRSTQVQFQQSPVDNWIIWPFLSSFYSTNPSIHSTFFLPAIYAHPSFLHSILPFFHPSYHSPSFHSSFHPSFLVCLPILSSFIPSFVPSSRMQCQSCCGLIMLSQLFHLLWEHLHLLLWVNGSLLASRHQQPSQPSRHAGSSYRAMVTDSHGSNHAVI